MLVGHQPCSTCRGLLLLLLDTLRVSELSVAEQSYPAVLAVISEGSTPQFARRRWECRVRCSARGQTGMRKPEFFANGARPLWVFLPGVNPVAQPQVYGLRVSTPGYFSDNKYQRPLASGRCGR